MNYFWFIVACIEVLVAGLLLFGLLTSCVARWRKKNLAFAVLAVFVLCVVGVSVLAIATGYRLFITGPHFNTLKHLFIVTVALSLIGYLAIARIGWRRCDPDALPAAATWPRSRLLMACLVALSLSAVTHWNVKLSVQQRLGHEEGEAQVMALSVMPGRPIDSLNAAILYEPVFERLPGHDRKHKVVQDDWLDFDKPLDTDDPVLRELLANHRRDLDTLVRASTRPQCYYRIPLRDAIGDGDYSWIGSMHLAGKLLAVDTRVKIADGDLKDAVNSTSAMFRMARHLDQTPTLLPLLVSQVIDALAINCVQALLNHPDISADTLRGLQLETRADYRRILRRVSIFEEAVMTTYVKGISTEGFNFVDKYDDAEFAEPGQKDALGTFFWKASNPYFIEHELEVFGSTYRQLRALLDQPWSVVAVQYAKFAGVRHRGVLATVLIPEWESLVVPVIIGDARHRLCRLAVAMRQYELEHGKLPDNFGALTQKYIDDVPLDPSTEEPFKMENVEGGVRLFSGGIEAWDRNEYPGDRLKGKVEMFLKSRKQAEN